MKPITNKVYGCLLVLSLTGGAAAPRTGAAQDPAWNATLIVQPYPSPFLSGWERNPQTAILTVLYSGTAAREFRVEGTLRSAQHGPFARALSPVLSFPFGPSTQLLTAADLPDWRILSYESSYADIAMRAGVLPQGQYEACVRVLNVQGTQLAQACANFTIALPDPPQLVLPGNGTLVETPQPVFQWTPVMGPPELGLTYRLRVAEQRRGQTPQSALQSNIPHLELEIPAVPLAVYPADALPFEEGRAYVWQVETLDGSGAPITAGQRHSEIWSFTYRGSITLPPLTGAFPDPFDLLPGVARLYGANQVGVRETEYSYILDGSATLELEGPLRGSVGVELRDLEIDKWALPGIRLLSGRVTGRLSPDAVPAELRGPYVRFDDLEYTPASGLVLAATADLPGARAVRLNGRVTASAAGLSGLLTAEASGAGALFTAGADPVALRVRRMEASYPAAAIELTAALDVLGRDAGCRDVVGRLDMDGRISALVSCQPALELPLAPGVEQLLLRLRTLSGTVAVETAAPGSLAYELTTAGDVLLAGEAVRCRAGVELLFADGSVQPVSFQPLCDPLDASIDLEWLRLALSGLEVERFDYRSDGRFDFAFRLNARLRIPSLPDFPLPELADIVFRSDGIEFPELDVLVDRPRFDLGGFGIRVRSLRMPRWTLPLASWERRSDRDSEGRGGFRFTVGLDSITLPQLPQVAPLCLTSGAFEVTSAELAEGRLAIAAAERVFDPACGLPLGGGASFELHSIGAEIAVAVMPQLEVEQSLSARGALVLPPLFQCPGETERRLTLGTSVALSPDGKLSGSASGLEGGCPFTLGGLTVALANLQLDFGEDGGAQTALLSGGAQASFAFAGQPITGTGNIALDLIAGRIRGGRVDFQGPFRFDLPREAPALSFRVGAAHLDSLGLHISGQQELLLPGGQTGAVTFDDVVFHLTELAIVSGRVVFHSAFAFELGLLPGGNLSWRAVAPGAPLATEPGARLDLPTQIVLDSAGVSVSGDGGALLSFEDRLFDGLVLRASDDFALALEPFRVRRGVLELEHDGVRVAHVDRLGFHPNVAYFGLALIPDRLGLPNEDVAYLELRDAQGELRIDAEVTSTGVRIVSRDGMVVPLVVPALQFDAATAPEAYVTFDITLDPLASYPVAGSFGARVPQSQLPAFDLRPRGVPFVVDSIGYDAENAGRVLLAGRAGLFDAAQGPEAAVVLALDGGGNIEGEVQIDGPIDPIELRGGGGLRLLVQRIDGSISAQPKLGTAHFDLELESTLALTLDGVDEYEAGATVGVTPHGVQVRALSLPDVGDPALEVGFGRLRLSDFRVPVLDYEPVARAWDFELLFDAELELTGLDGLVLPGLQDVALRPNGLSLPGFEIPQLAVAPIGIAGFNVRPLAFRMEPLHIDWFAFPPPDIGFGFDLEVGFGDDAPPDLRAIQLTVLNAGYSNGRFTGTVEPRNLPQPAVVPLPGEDMALRVLQLGGALEVYDDEQHVAVTVGGSFLVPESMRCGSEQNWIVELPPTAVITLSSAGWASGTAVGIVPSCPLELGPLALSVTSSSLSFFAAGSAQQVEMDLDGWLQLPGPTGDTVQASGSLGVDLVGLRVLRGHIDIDAPFRWDLPADDPFLRFVVNSARLDTLGLRLSGTGSLDLTADELDTAVPATTADAQAQVAVTFDDLRLRLPDFRVTGGRATVEQSFALDVGLEQTGQPRFRARDPSEPREPGAGIRVVLPERVSLEDEGLLIDGTASAELEYGDMLFDALSVDFAEFVIAHEPGVRVAAGRAGFLLEQEEIAYVDATGFWPGNVFGVLPVPDRLGLPSEDVAYLQLRDEATGALLVQSASSEGGLTLGTASGQPIPLVVPALARDGSVPVLLIHFQATVNPASHQFVSGFVRAEAQAGAPALFTLEDFGIPLDVRTLAYEKVGNEYVLRLGALLTLPESLGGHVLAFDDVLITQNGLAGSVEIGSYTDSYQPEAEAVFNHALAQDVSLELYGARADFAPDSVALRLAGAVRAALFTEGDQPPAALFLTGQVGPDGLALGADVGHLPHLPVAAATFELVGVGTHAAVEVTASMEELTLRLSGILRVPSLSETLALTIDGLEVGTNGIVFPAVALHGAEELQAFTLFGATFTLSDSIAGTDVVHPAIAFEYAQQVLRLTLSGEIQFLGNSSRFYGFQVGTDGSLALAQANLLSEPVTLVPDVITLAQLSIVETKLRADLDISLPDPFATDRLDDTFFTIAPDGTVDGGASIVLWEEAEGFGGDRTQFSVGVATLHPRYVGLALQFGALQQSALELVADVYLANQADNRILIGNRNGNTVAPGLRVAFDGGTQWGNFGLAREFDFDFDIMRLTLTNVSAPQNGEFAVGFSGSFSLNLGPVTGGIDFEEFQISRSGKVSVNSAGITGGELSIADVIAIAVSDFSYSDTPTEIEVAAGGMPSAEQEASVGTETVAVQSYVRFGGSIDVVNLFSGGVEEFLAYRTEDGLRHMIVRRADLEIQSIVKMQADMRYREIAGGGFEMVLGASGKVLENYDVMLVGAIEYGETTRAGIFVASAVQIPVVPPIVVITQLGGGFFYNPKPEYLQLVRQYADVGGPAADKIQAPVGQFAVLLYGGVSIVDAAVIEGRVLLTAMPTALQLDGAVEVLSQGDRFRGDITLAVGLGKAYAEGNIHFVVDYNPVLNAAGAMEFFVYGANAWGIMGGANMTYLATVSAQSEFFIGPPGFMVSGEIRHSFDIWIVEVRSAFGMMAWYHRAADQYGAYTKIEAKASVLGGAATAKGDLHGALVLAGSPQIYAAGSLRGCAAGQCKSISAWARFRNGSISGGKGSDSSLDAVIAQAQAVADEMEQAQAEAEAAITAAQLAAAVVTMSDDELAAAYDVMQRWNRDQFGAAAAYAASLEQKYAHQSAHSAYYDWSLSILMQDGAPQIDVALVQQLSDSVEVQLHLVEAGREAVLSALEQIQVHVGAVEARFEREPPGSPMHQFSFAQPVTTTATDERGNEIKLVEAGSMPGFDLDAGAAAEAVGVMEEMEQAAAAEQERVRAILTSLEEGLASVRAAVLHDGGGASLLGYTTLLAGTRNAAQRPFAVQADMILRRQDWMRAKLSDMGVASGRLAMGVNRAFVAPPPRLAEIEGILDHKSNALSGTPLRDLAYERLELLDAWVAGQPTPQAPQPLFMFAGAPVSLSADNQLVVETVKDMVDGLPASVADLLDGLASGQPMAQQFASEYAGTPADQQDSLASLQARDAGLLIWYKLAAAGMRAADTRATTALAELRTAHAERLRPVDEPYADVSVGTRRVFAAHAEMTGVLYDLYDAYIDADWPDAADLVARRAELLAELEVPRLDDVTVTSVQNGYFATQTIQWTGSHPRGIHEFLFDDAEPDALLGAGLRSVGGTGSVTTYLFPPRRGTVNRSVHAAVRGGAGYIGVGRADYTLEFAPAPYATTPVTSTSSGVVDDTPPTRPVVTFPHLPQTTGPDAQPVAWTTVPNVFEPRWSAYDGESGIAAYEYAIGTTPAGTELRDWTPAGGRTSVRVEDAFVTLEAPTYVSVRARNGAELWSEVGISPLLRLDTIAPRFDALAAIEPVPAPAGVGVDATPARWQACPIPIPAAVGAPTEIVLGTAGGAGSISSDAQPARRAFVRPAATDEQSGIWRYHWRVADAPAEAYTESGWTAHPADQGEIEVTGAPLDFEHAFYISLVAQNRAGLVTAQPVAFGPFTVPDPTAPLPPRFCLGRGSNGELRLDVEQAGSDPETDVVGHAYRVVLENGTVVRAWPDSADWHALATGATALPFAELAAGSRYHVELRALNGHGQWGRAARSGPVIHDVTAPPTPSVGASTSDGRQLTLSVGALNDPQSGLFTQHFAIYTAPSTTTTTSRTGFTFTTSVPPVLVHDWRIVPDATTGSYARQVVLPATLSVGDYQIRVRTINGAGLVSSVGIGTFTVPIPTELDPIEEPPTAPGTLPSW